MRALDWELLPHFLAVARAGSLRSGAQLIGASYGTVNRNIQALETSYGVRLFHRSKSGFALTEFGENLLPAAEEAEQKIIAARRRVEGRDMTEAGKIRFSLTPTLAYDVISPIVARFSEKYPSIDIEMRLTPEIESIPNDETDISLRAADKVNDDVVARRLFQLDIGLYAGKSYLDTIVSKAGERGAGLTWIGMAGGQSSQDWLSKSEYPQAEVRHSVADGYMRARLVNMNAGMSHLPVFFEHAFADIRRMPGSVTFKGPWLWVLLHSDMRKTVRVRRFVDFLSSELQRLKQRPDFSL